MALTGLKEDALKLILFGGKGGVGKTSCAASTGLYLSRDFKTLLVSTDPAHSLSDSLGQEIGSQIKEIKGIRNLNALEINAEKALSQFKVKYQEQIKKILDNSTYLDEEDINAIFSLPIPGIDEVMGFKTIVDLIEEGEYDKYIVDTAPTGHALRLLTLPQLLDDWIKVLAKMRWKYRYMVESFSGKYHPDTADGFLVEMKKTVKRIEGLLRDGRASEFIAVTIPEDMAILETERLVDNLHKYGIKVKQLVINDVLLLERRSWGKSKEGNCEFCRQRSQAHQEYIQKIRRKFPNLRMTVISLQAQEVKGVESLEKFSRLLTFL